MNEANVIKYLKNDLSFDEKAIKKLKIFSNYLLNYNKRYNLISRSTESSLWHRHILDSAQIIKHLPKNDLRIDDFGSGAGFPGIILSIYDQKDKFHVKLYEKSQVKRNFLCKIRDELNLKFDLQTDVYSDTIKTDIIVARAFKKLDKILKISREIVKKPHKLIILKGRNAQTEINKVSLTNIFIFKLLDIITDPNSKILIVDVNR